VTFMSAATIDELLRGRDLLLSRSRTVALRSPSRCARRLLDFFGLAGLVESGEQTGPVAVDSPWLPMCSAHDGKLVLIQVGQTPGRGLPTPPGRPPDVSPSEGRVGRETRSVN
jgi:hypothetical protein